MPLLARSRPLLAGLRTAHYGVAAARQWAAAPGLSLAARQASSLTETSSPDKPEVPHGAGVPSPVGVAATHWAVSMAGVLVGNAAVTLAFHSLGYPMPVNSVALYGGCTLSGFVAYCFAPELIHYMYPPPAPSAEPYDMTRLEVIKPSVVGVSALRNFDVGHTTAAEAKVADAQVRVSGLIWDHLGHVVTNAQIGKGDRKVLVKLDNGDQYWTAVVGTNDNNSLAVLKLLAPPAVLAALQPARLDTSASASFGGMAVATGYPDGQDSSVAKGVVTAAGAMHIQHNAAVGTCASGGPLLNNRGAYIGINLGTGPRLPLDRLCTFLGIFNPFAKNRRGYAVPMDKVQDTVAHMLRPKLGVVTASEPNGLQLEGLTGCCVAEVNPDASPLQLSYNLRSTIWGNEGRLFPGDCILSLAGRAVESPSDLRAALDGRSVGDSVAITVRRDKQELTLTATLGEGGAEGKVAMKWD